MLWHLWAGSAVICTRGSDVHYMRVWWTGSCVWFTSRVYFSMILQTTLLVCGQSRNVFYAPTVQRHTHRCTYIRSVHNALLVRHSFLAINSLWSAPDNVYIIVLQFYSVTSPTQWHYMYVSSMLVLVPALACWLVHVTGMKGSGCTVARTIGCTHWAACRKGLAGLREAYWVKVRWVVVQPMRAHHLWSQG